MAHNRKLVLGAVALTMGNTDSSTTLPAANLVRDDLERELIESEYLSGAPFQWVSLIIRYGLKYELVPQYRGINKKYGDIGLAIEIDTHELLEATLQQTILIFRKAALRALVHAGDKYGLSTERLKVLLTEL
jgi:Immunity protein 39